MSVILKKELDYLPGGFFVYQLDASRSLLYLNSEVMRLFRCKNMDEFIELTKETLLGMVHEEDKERIGNIVSGAPDGKKKQFSIDFRLNTLDSTVRYVNVYANIDTEAQNGPLAYCFMADVTLKTEESLDVLRRKDRYHDLYRKIRLSEDRFRFISSFAGVMFYEYDLTNKENSKFENSLDVLGYTEWDLQEVYRESETSDCLRYLMSDEDYAQTEEFYNEFNENGEAHMELRLRHKDGTYHWFSDNRCLTLSPSGEASYIRGCLWNTDKTHQVIASLQQSVKRDTMTGLLNKTSAFSIIDRHLEENRGSLCAFLFFDMDNFKLINDTFGHGIGDSIIRMMANELTNAFRQSDVLARFGGDEFFAFLPNINATMPILEKVKRIITNLKNAKELQGTDFVLSTSVGVVFTTNERDASTLFEKADKALYSAKLLGKGQFYVYDDTTSVTIDDPYTMGMNERKEFLDGVDSFLKEAPVSQKYALVSIGVENFQTFNEWFGPRLGDKYIAEISYVLHEFELNHNATVAYFGRDHFGLFLPYDREPLEELASRLVSISKSLSQTVGFLPALGVYPIRDKSVSATVMFECASETMKNCFSGALTRLSYYNPKQISSVDREKALLMEIKDGLARDEFGIYFHPKMDINTGLIIGAEVVSQWNHPKRGLMDATRYIPLLEKYGLTALHDTVIWEKVCSDMRAWLDRYPKIVLPVSVNVTAIDMLSCDVCATFDALIEKYRLDRRDLRIEVAETTYSEYEELVDTEIERLRARGYLVFMDNFTTSYSSFRRLREIRVDALKISISDFSTYKENFAESNDYTILKSLIQLAHSLGIPMIVEGVSTKEEIEYLRGIDCRFVQGQYFYPPLTLAEWEKLLLAHPELIYTRDISAAYEQRIF